MKTRIVLETIVSMLILGISPVFAQDFSYDEYYNWEDRNPFWEAHSEDCPFHNGVNWNTGEEMEFAGILPPQFAKFEMLVDTDLGEGENPKNPDRADLNWTFNSQGLEYFRLSNGDCAYLYRAYSSQKKIYISRLANHFGFVDGSPTPLRNLRDIKTDLASHFIDVAIDYDYDHIGDIDVVQISSNEIYLLLPLDYRKNNTWPLLVVYRVWKPAQNPGSSVCTPEIAWDFVGAVEMHGLCGNQSFGWVASHPNNPELLFSSCATKNDFIDYVEEETGIANDLDKLQVFKVDYLKDPNASGHDYNLEQEWHDHMAVSFSTPRDLKLTFDTQCLNEGIGLGDPYMSRWFIRDTTKLPLTTVQGGDFSPSGLLFLAIQGCYATYDPGELKYEECTTSWTGLHIINSYSGKVMGIIDYPLQIGCEESHEYEGVTVYDFDQSCLEHDGSEPCIETTAYADIHTMKLINNYPQSDDDLTIFHARFENKDQLYAQPIADRDGDGIPDGLDPCPTIPEEWDQDHDCLSNDCPSGYEFECNIDFCENIHVDYDSDSDCLPDSCDGIPEEHIVGECVEDPCPNTHKGNDWDMDCLPTDCPEEDEDCEPDPCPVVHFEDDLDNDCVPERDDAIREAAGYSGSENYYCENLGGDYCVGPFRWACLCWMDNCSPLGHGYDGGELCPSDGEGGYRYCYNPDQKNRDRRLEELAHMQVLGDTCDHKGLLIPEIEKHLYWFQDEYNMDDIEGRPISALLNSTGPPLSYTVEIPFGTCLQPQNPYQYFRHGAVTLQACVCDSLSSCENCDNFVSTEGSDYKISIKLTFKEEMYEADEPFNKYYVKYDNLNEMHPGRVQINWLEQEWPPELKLDMDTRLRVRFSHRIENQEQLYSVTRIMHPLADDAYIFPVADIESHAKLPLMRAMDLPFGPGYIEELFGPGVSADPGILFYPSGTKTVDLQNAPGSVALPALAQPALAASVGQFSKEENPWIELEGDFDQRVSLLLFRFGGQDEQGIYRNSLHLGIANDEEVHWRMLYEGDDGGDRSSDWPSPRMNANLFYDPWEMELMLLGGYGSIGDGKEGYLSDLYILDMKTGSWETLPSMPRPRLKVAVAHRLGHGQIWVVGGSLDGGLMGENTLFVFDRTAGEWSEIDVESPISDWARMSSTLTYDQILDRFFLFGGSQMIDGSHFDNIWMLNPESNPPEWTEVRAPSEELDQRSGPTELDDVPILFDFYSSRLIVLQSDSVWAYLFNPDEDEDWETEEPWIRLDSGGSVDGDEDGDVDGDDDGGGDDGGCTTGCNDQTLRLVREAGAAGFSDLDPNAPRQDPAEFPWPLLGFFGLVILAVGVRRWIGLRV